MFLKEYTIRRYGPLPDSGKVELGHFNLFYGPNEEGKTLTIDALLKILFGGRGFRDLKAMKRVDEVPDGYLVIGGEDNNEIKMPESGLLPDHFGVSASEFRNIFLIRDSDLQISSEGDFYRGITSRLTGMRSVEIGKIKERLYELGKMTPGGDFLNSSPEKLKDKYKKATTLLQRVNLLIASLQDEGFSRFEEELAALEAQCLEIKEQLNLYSAANSRERFEKGRTALGLLRDSLSEMDLLRDFNEEGYSAWQHAQSGLDFLHGDLSRLEKEIRDKKQNLEIALGELKACKLAYKQAEQARKLANEQIEPLLSLYEREESVLSKQDIILNSSAFKIAVLISALSLLISMAGIIFSPSALIYTLFFSALFLTMLAGSLRFRFLAKKGTLREIELKLSAEAEKLGLAAGNCQVVRAALGELGCNLDLETGLLAEAEKSAEWLQNEHERSGAEFSEKERIISEAGISINQISQAVEVETIDQYSSSLKRKQQLKSEIDKQKSILESHFSGKAGSVSEKSDPAFWDDQLEELKKYANAAPDIKYDQRRVDELNQQLERLTTSKQELTEKLADRREELRDIEKELNDLIPAESGEHFPCQTTVDLEAAEKNLEHWLDERERDRASAQAAIAIFNEIGEEEEEKVTALFGADSPVSSNFSLITGGRYRKVVFDSRENNILVTRSDNTELEAYQLSGGTFDQLYFSIRLALAVKLLEGEKGFFILDDPFIKADPDRLKTLFTMLFSICKEGWQILYFSSKGEVKETLRGMIDSGDVREIAIGSRPE